MVFSKQSTLPKIQSPETGAISPLLLSAFAPLVTYTFQNSSYETKKGLKFTQLIIVKYFLNSWMGYVKGRRPISKYCYNQSIDWFFYK
jgi:hypothetical protein